MASAARRCFAFLLCSVFVIPLLWVHVDFQSFTSNHNEEKQRTADAVRSSFPLSTNVPLVEAKLDVQHLQGRISGIQGILGITECGSTRFAEWAPNGSVIITDERCKSTAIFRACAGPGAQSGGTHSFQPVSVLLHSTLMASLGNCTCIALRCEAACHPSLSKEECDAFGKRNVLVAQPKDKKVTGTPSSRLEKGVKPGGKNVILMLLDSVSWADFDQHFPMTKATLRELVGVAQQVSFRKMNAVGAHSATNHAALLTGYVPRKCARFKTRREGVPRKSDGVVYRRYMKLEERHGKIESERGSQPLLHHLAAAFKRRGYRTGMYYPLPFRAWEATCLKLFDEADAASFLDVFQYRFFNEAVHMFNRAINGSQGCIGAQHSMDYVNAFTVDFFSKRTEEDRKNKPGFAIIAEQTPHQSQWGNGTISYFDFRLSHWFKLLNDTGVLAESIIILTADHGLGFGIDDRAALMPRLANILNPILQFIVPKSLHSPRITSITPTDEGGKKFHHDIASLLKRWSSCEVSHFDTFATMHGLLDILSPPPPTITGNASLSLSGNHERDAFGLNLLASPTTHQQCSRSCEEMGLFLHACRHFRDEHLGVKVLKDTGLMLSFTRFLQSVDKQFRTVGANKFCHSLANDAHLVLLNATRRMFPDETSYISGVVSVSVRKSTKGNRTLLFSFDTRMKRTSSGKHGGGKFNIMGIAKMLRVSTYREDELSCGGKVLALDRSLDLQYCACRYLSLDQNSSTTFSSSDGGESSSVALRGASDESHGFLGG